MLWKWIKKVKDFNSWYSFGSNIVRLIIWIGISSGVSVSVLGVVAAIIKGVPWPITLMAGLAVFLAVVCLAATPLIIRAAIQSITPVPEPTQTRQPVRPHWDAWKHVEKFTVHQAACLLENLEPSTHPKDSKISAWMDGLCAAIRTGQLAFIPRREMGLQKASMREADIRIQKQEANSTTEIPKAGFLDFAKRNDRDLKLLGLVNRDS
jgi:hypothetical protein